MIEFKKTINALQQQIENITINHNHNHNINQFMLPPLPQPQHLQTQLSHQSSHWSSQHHMPPQPQPQLQAQPQPQPQPQSFEEYPVNVAVTNDNNNDNDIDGETIKNGENGENNDDDVESEHYNDILNEIGVPESAPRFYKICDFQTNPIGAKRNIYIDKSFTKEWINGVFPSFADESMMYYWLDYTTAIQMCHRYAKKYLNKRTNKFYIAIINYELHDASNNLLYGIIELDEKK
eukprot:541281_1